MPVMDGYAMCHAIKSDPALQDIPIILLTALSDPEDIIRGLNAKADNYLTKPYDERIHCSHASNTCWRTRNSVKMPGFSSAWRSSLLAKSMSSMRIVGRFWISDLDL